MKLALSVNMISQLGLLQSITDPSTLTQALLRCLCYILGPRIWVY